MTDLGRMQPQQTEMENQVLGASMLEVQALNEVIRILNKEDFYSQKNRVIFKAIQKLSSQGLGVDLMTVYGQLKKDCSSEAVGGVTSLVEMTNTIGSTANIEHNCFMIKESSIKRKIISFSNHLIMAGYDDSVDVFDLIDKAQNELIDITGGLNLKLATNHFQMADDLEKHIKECDERRSKSGLNGLPTMLENVDRKARGWKEGDLIIIAARPGMGKTAAIKNICDGGSYTKKVGLIFSLEMSSRQFFARVISEKINEPYLNIMEGRIEEHNKTDLASKVSKFNHEGKSLLFVDDTASLTISQLRAKAKALKMSEEVDYIVVDYLQLMSGNSKNQNREQEISQISRGLKILAKELEIPVIALSQLSRSVESRGGDKKPMLSDLRESGAIEQDADQVIFLWRPDYYGFEGEYEYNGMSYDVEGWAEWIFAKNRGGSLGSASVKFHGETTKFYNPD